MNLILLSLLLFTSWLLVMLLFRRHLIRMCDFRKQDASMLAALWPLVVLSAISVVPLTISVYTLIGAVKLICFFLNLPDPGLSLNLRLGKGRDS